MDRARRSELLRDYFDLQLRFAAVRATFDACGLPEAVLRYTNLHRRFGLGHPNLAEPCGRWRAYVDGLAGLAGHARQLDWTLTFFVDCKPEPPLPGQAEFGCFACDPPDREGAVKIHFTHRDASGRGPLSRDRSGARRDELTAMLVHVRDRHPDARAIRGGSWLYSRDAYRRLFPPEYRDSCRIQAVDDFYQGSSRWGQFLDRHGATRSDLRSAFLANLERFAPAQPWAAFPVPRYSAQAPIAAFYRHAGID